jgi:hypothetical protein
MTKSDKIKEIMLFLMLGGEKENKVNKEINKEEQLILTKILLLLADLSGFEGFDKADMNETTIFVEKSLKMLEKEYFDDWIDYYFSKLEENEEYKLLNELKL